MDHEAFVSLGKQLSSNNEIITVNLQIDPERKDNLAKRYSVPVEDFPALRLFINHDYRNITEQEFRKLKPVTYPTERDYNLNSMIVLNPITMRLFLWTQANIRTPLPNCTTQLDDLAEEFVYLLEQGDKEAELKEIQERVDEIYTKSKGKLKYSSSIYGKFMKKASEDGLPYFDYEHRRIKKLLQDNYGVKPEQKRKLSARFNILQSFRLRHYESMLKENENARVRNLNPPRIEL